MKKILLFLVLASVGCSSNKLAMDNGGIKVEINEYATSSFIIDTGSSECTIPHHLVLMLHDNGKISKADLLPRSIYVLADGSEIDQPRIMLKSLKVGNKTIYNVEAAIGSGENSPLLLGTNALKKLGKIKIDYKNNTIKL